MYIKRYDELTETHKDVLREVGSIGTGSAATALSSLLSQTVRMTVPDVRILDYNDAIKYVGGPEEIIAGVLVSMSGDVNGIMLYIQKLDFVQLVLQEVCNKHIADYPSLDEMDVSALEEIGNIIISSYVNALSSLSDTTIELSVPGISVNMLGAIMAVPMAELGYEANKIMMIDGKFICNGIQLSSHLLMLPDVNSLNRLLEKLVITHG